MYPFLSILCKDQMIHLSSHSKMFSQHHIEILKWLSKSIRKINERSWNGILMTQCRKSVNVASLLMRCVDEKIEKIENWKGMPDGGDYN